MRHPPTLFLLAALAGAGCAQGTLEITVDGLPDPAGGDDHATEAYRLRNVSAEIVCEGEDELRICVVEIHGDDGNAYGESRSVSFNWPALAGDLDFADVPPALPPAAFAHTDDVTGEHRTFDWACLWIGGTASLDSSPLPGEALSGSYDLNVRCVDDLGGAVTTEVLLSGNLDVVPTGDEP